MQTFCCFSIYFFLLSCAPSPLSCASSALNLGRRHLSDDAAALLTPASPISPPFFPLESSPPPLPPPPPPPPAFASFPTFPANISALVLPRSPKPHSTSPALLVPAISAVLVVATVIGVALFLYGRWRGQNRHFKETNTSRCSSSSTSHSHGYDEEPRHVITNNFSVSASSPTSEVLYLGGDEPDRVITSFVKPESPEIRPLPPLPRSFQPSYEADVHCERNNNNNDEDEEDEEFFSPLASLAGSANSSPSRPGFEPERSYVTSSCSSSSSSGWVSPARSFSITLSPVQQQRSSSRFSDVSSDQNLQSPSPERLRVRSSNRHVSSSLRMFSFFNQNLSFPRISSASTSPDRGCTVRTPLSSLYSSVSNSPDGLFRKFINSSPPIWNDFSRNVKSVLLSSESLSSRRDFVINIGGQAAVAAPPPPTRPPPLVPPSHSFVVQNDGRKPSFSDKLNQGPCQNTAWDCLKTSSFKLNKEIVETLFISNSSSPNINQRGLTYDLPNQSEVLYQNIATLLQLLNLTTKDVCNALLEGDSDTLGAELLDCLSRLAPSKEEEKKLRSCSDDTVFIKLVPAERFLKELLHVPFVFKRVDALLSVANFDSEIEYLRRSFGVVQAACDELRNNKTFSRLLEAILKTGNKMSVGTNSHAFKFDTLLKLAEVKGLDGRSSVLHFVVQDIIKSEGSVEALDGIRNLSSEMDTVKKSADIEFAVLTSGVLKLCHGVKNIKELLILSEESGCSGDQWLKFEAKMARFLETAGEEILKIKAQESSTLSALEEVTELFHGGSFKEEGQSLRVFMAVRDFLSTLDEVCDEMGDRFSA